MFLKFFCNTFWQNLSFSTKAIVSKWPVASSPKLKPPMPLNKSNTLYLLSIIKILGCLFLFVLESQALPDLYLFP